MKIENYQAIKNILNQWDLLGVMPYNGGHQDEYDWFAGEIKKNLENDISLNELENYLEKEITDYFGLELNEVIKQNVKKYSAEIIKHR